MRIDLEMSKICRNAKRDYSNKTPGICQTVLEELDVSPTTYQFYSKLMRDEIHMSKKTGCMQEISSGIVPDQGSDLQVENYLRLELCD